MNKSKITAVILASAIVLALLSPGGTKSMLNPAGTAYAQDDWKMEFDTVCAKSQDSGAIPFEELKELVTRCDKLRLRIDKLDETQKKVYLKRLQMCRDLFSFVLESREKK